jgi:hypothetical protein
MDTQFSGIKESTAPVRRMRTLSGLAAHYRKQDPDTAITEHFLRQKILAGEIPFTWAGNKRLLAIEDVDAILSNTVTMDVSELQFEHIRRIN